MAGGKAGSPLTKEPLVDAPKSSKPRGRPRSEKARKAILKCAYGLLIEDGVGRLTIEAVANRAGVGKPTIYRSWANARELAMAALLAQPAPPSSATETASPLDDLDRQVSRVISIFSSLRGRQITQMMAASEQESELSKAFRNQIILTCREEGRVILERAQAHELVRKNIDMEVVLDLVYGPIFYRLLVGHAVLTEQVGQNIVATVLAGIRSDCRH